MAYLQKILMGGLLVASLGLAGCDSTSTPLPQPPLPKPDTPPLTPPVAPKGPEHPQGPPATEPEGPSLFEGYPKAFGYAFVGHSYPENKGNSIASVSIDFLESEETLARLKGALLDYLHQQCGKRGPIMTKDGPHHDIDYTCSGPERWTIRLRYEENPGGKSLGNISFSLPEDKEIGVAGLVDTVLGVEKYKKELEAFRTRLDQ